MKIERVAASLLILAFATEINAEYPEHPIRTIEEILLTPGPCQKLLGSKKSLCISEQLGTESIRLNEENQALIGSLGVTEYGKIFLDSKTGVGSRFEKALTLLSEANMLLFHACGQRYEENSDELRNCQLEIANSPASR